MKARRILWSALAALTLGATAAAADDEHVTFGSGWWTQSAPEAKYQEFRVVPRGAFLESFLLQEPVGGLSVAGWGRNTGRADQGYGLTAARGVRWRADLTYQEIPHLFSQVARSLYGETVPGEYRLPDSLQRTNAEYPTAYVATMTNALASANAVALSTRTDVSQLRLRARPGPAWRVELRGSERQRSGRQPYSASFGFSDAIELPLALSQRTTDGDAIVTYERKDVRVQASAGVSLFRNRIGAMLVDNPRRIADAVGGARQARLDLAPDNDVVRGQFGLSWRLPKSSMLYGTFGLSQGTQDDDFVPYTTNTALPQSNPDSLPAGSLNGKVTTMTEDVRLITRPFDRLSGVLRFHGETFDNESDEILFTGFSPYDAGWTANAKHNHLEGWSRNVYGLDLDFTLTDWARLGILGELRNREFDVREVEKDGETVLGASLWLDPTDALGLTASFRSGKREIDDFVDADYRQDGNPAGIYVEQPGLRRFDVANRDQTLAAGALDWSPAAKFDASVDYTYTLNDYPDSRYGLTRAEEHLVVVDGTYHATRALDLTGGYGFGQQDARQASNESNHTSPPSADAATDWWADTRDRTVFIYGRGEWWAKPNRYQVSADYTFTRSLGEYHLSNAAATAQDVPNTYYRRHELTVQGLWKVNPALDLSWRYGYDNFIPQDFAATNVPYLGVTGTSATAIYLGDSIQGYRAHRVALLASKRF